MQKPYTQNFSKVQSSNFCLNRKKTRWGWKTGCHCSSYQRWLRGARNFWLWWKWFRCQVFKEETGGEGSWAKEGKIHWCSFYYVNFIPIGKIFCSAGFAYGEHRQSLPTVNLEMQLFLKCNQSLWNKETVSKIFNETNQTDQLVRNYFYIWLMYQFAS